MNLMKTGVIYMTRCKRLPRRSQKRTPRNDPYTEHRHCEQSDNPSRHCEARSAAAISSVIIGCDEIGMRQSLSCFY